MTDLDKLTIVQVDPRSRHPLAGAIWVVDSVNGAPLRRCNHDEEVPHETPREIVRTVGFIPQLEPRR